MVVYYVDLNFLQEHPGNYTSYEAEKEMIEKENDHSYDTMVGNFVSLE